MTPVRSSPPCAPFTPSTSSTPRGHTISFGCRHAARTDLCVYEIGNAPNRHFIWPYLLHFPGVLVLRTASLYDGRAAILSREHRLDDCGTEMAFSGASRRITARWNSARGTWPMLRVPLLASRLTVVCDAALADSLQRDYEGARVRYAPVGVPGPESQDVTGGPHAFAPADATARPLTIGVVDPTRGAAVHRAVQRAQAAGASITLLTDPDVNRVLREADVILSLHWPSGGEPLTAAHLGMAAGKPVVVSETRTTAAWPALDPQTWQPRDGRSGEPPIVVSIDPRDEEHSLMLAMRRLSTDQVLRGSLGRAARAWWEENATPRRAVKAWMDILQEAVALEPPARPQNWPSHLPSDGTERARAILSEFGVSVDFLS